jgi:folylpolyglutamate synthase/dihydropteroate synthase
VLLWAPTTRVWPVPRAWELQGRVHRQLGRLGNPQNALPVVHVAGSKAKGSVTAMLAAVLQAAGYRVATYTRCAGHHPCW